MKTLKVNWTPSLKDDLHAFVVCGVLTKEQAGKILKEFENEKL